METGNMMPSGGGIDQVNVIGLEVRVRRHKLQTLNPALGDNHAIERITVMLR